MAASLSSSAPLPARGELYPIGRRRLLGGVRPRAIIVAADDGMRCTVLTSANDPELHRRLRSGATNLLVSARKTGEPPFSPGAILDEISRQLPGGHGIGKPRRVDLRDVHGTGRILFDDLVGGTALDEDLEMRRPAPGSSPRRVSATYA